MSGWKKASDYAITRGKQSIAKVYLDGCTLFELWDGEERIGHYNDADEARQMADEVESKRGIVRGEK